MFIRKLIFLTVFLFGLSASPQVHVNWVNYPGGVSVATDESNNVYTANWEYNPGGDIILTKRDADGTIIWEEAFDNTDISRHEVATWVDTDDQGNIVITGTIRSGYSNPVDANSLVMKYDPSGNLLWRIVYETDFDGSSTRKCLIDSENNIYILGLGNSGAGMVTTVKKFSPGGSVIWTYFDTTGIGAPVNFKFTPDNGILIISRSLFGSINGYAKIDMEGQNIWNYAGVNSLSIGDAAGDQDGNSYLLHGEYDVSNPGSVVKKLSSSGSLVWEQINTMAGFRIEVGSDGNPVISGYPNSGTAGAAFMKYNGDGNVLWQNPDADGPGLNLIAHSQMKLDGSDAAYLAAGTMFQMAVCKVNADGSHAWTATTAGSYAYAIDFGIDTSVFVTGGTTARLTQSGTLTAIRETDLPEMKVYPNPVTGDRVYLDIPQEITFPAELQIFSSTGQEVFHQELNESSTVIRPTGLVNGIYYLIVQTKEKVKKLKILISH